MKDILFDCTELYNNPIRTGIQRVVRELMRHWPAKGSNLHIVRFQPEVGLVKVPGRAIELLLEATPQTQDLPFEEIAEQLHALSADAQSWTPPRRALYFIPEVFFDPRRADFYQARLAEGAKLAMLAYDFIVYLRPDLFDLRSTAPFMHYLRLARAAQHVAHISKATRRDFQNRILHGPAARQTGPALPLGADGLPLERQTWDKSRSSFVVIGSIDRRKNQHVIAEAFQELWQAGHDARLVIIGRAFASADLSWLEAARASPNFLWLSDATDSQICEELRQARATIYLSEYEGYGLPPVESLHAGIPVISTEHMPSLEDVDRAGQIRLQSIDRPAIATAVEHLLDNDTAGRLWEDAAALQLPTWRKFAERTDEWLRTTWK